MMTEVYSRLSRHLFFYTMPLQLPLIALYFFIPHPNNRLPLTKLLYNSDLLMGIFHIGFFLAWFVYAMFVSFTFYFEMVFYAFVMIVLVLSDH